MGRARALRRSVVCCSPLLATLIFASAAAAEPADATATGLGIGLRVRAFSGLSTSFVDLADYAGRGADVHGLTTIKMRPGMQVLYSLGPLWRLQDLRPGLEVAYYPLYDIDHVDGVAGRDLSAALVKSALFVELVTRRMSMQLGFGLLYNAGDEIADKLTGAVVPGLHVATGPELRLGRWLSLNPMVKVDVLFADTPTGCLSLAISATLGV